MRLKAAILFCVALTACSPGKEARDESIIRARLNADIISSDPGTRRDLNTDAVVMHVVEGLVASREDGSVGPMLAKSWTISPDGRTYRFTLRQGVKFHNGATLTADDVVWSLNRYLAPETHWRCGADFGPNGIARIESVKALNPATVELTLDQPAPLLLTVLSRSDCGGTGIVHRSSVDSDGEWIKPIGTGPFKWGEWRRNQFVELDRFDGYQPLPGGPNGNGGGKHALVDKVRFNVIPDGSAASAGLMRGSLDLVDGLAPNELGAISNDPDIRLVDSPVMDMYGILLQTTDPVLSDPRMRQAIALSLDVEAIARVGTRGTATPNSSPIPTASPYFSAERHPMIRRDLHRARALAEAAGYDGRPITLITSHAPPEIYDVAIIVQAMARDAGINIDIVTLDWATQLARYSSGDYQAMVFGYSARLDPSLMFGAFTGRKATEPRKIWDTEDAHSLLKASIAASDRVERGKIFDAMDTAFRKEAPGIVLYNTKRITAMQQDVHGYRPWPGQTQRLWDVSVGPDTSGAKAGAKPQTAVLAEGSAR